jgi:hypothetical protein
MYRCHHGNRRVRDGRQSGVEAAVPQFSIMVCALFGGIAWWAERQRRRVGDGDPFPAKASRKHIGMAMSRLLAGCRRT